jgi:uroporphyrinogen decarboxylase
MRALDCQVLGVDWTVNLGAARRRVAEGNDGQAKALQGNIDPNVLFAPPARIEAEVAKVLQAFGAPHADRATAGPTHIFNLGHGISQFTPPEHVAALVQAVHTQSRQLRQPA